MRLPWVNVLLLLLIGAQFVSGWFGLTTGDRQWILWLHGIGAYALIVLLFGKASIVGGVWRRRKRWTAARSGFLLLLALTLFVLLLGLLWTFQGPIYIGGFSLVSLHIYFAIPLLLLLAFHSWRMRWIWRVAAARNRRAFLNMGSVTLVGGLLWLLRRDLPRARRFTGSYERGSYGGEFPTVSWINDNPAAIAPAAWQLQVSDVDGRRMQFDFERIASLAQESIEATLDCTGGFYTVQRWQGVSVARLLQAAGAELNGARSISFTSVTGYERRFALPQAGGFLLAVAVAGRPLSHGHGFPLRLVAPGRRGVDWVKWIDHISINRAPAILQSPLPLQ